MFNKQTITPHILFPIDSVAPKLPCEPGFFNGAGHTRLSEPIGRISPTATAQSRTSSASIRRFVDHRIVPPFKCSACFARLTTEDTSNQPGMAWQANGWLRKARIWENLGGVMELSDREIVSEKRTHGWPPEKIGFTRVVRAGEFIACSKLAFV